MKEIGATSPSQLKTAVLFIVFNRPEETRKVFDRIRAARPARLFVAADGPRQGRFDDSAGCEKVREIATGVDWDCEVATLFRDRNLGCKAAVASAIDWVFEHVGEAIILEDDCLPDPSFFPFCEELLERYRHDERIAQIGGNNFQFGKRRTDYSYSFSRYNHIWGWATWRRAWRHYDMTMRLWPRIRKGGQLKDWLQDSKAVRYWTYHFQEAYQGRIDTWDYQWTFACWVQEALTVLPNVNLVSNIGFGEGSTHTRGKGRVSRMEAEAVSFPLVHPPDVLRDAQADNRTERLRFSSGILPSGIRGKLLRLVKRIRT